MAEAELKSAPVRSRYVVYPGPWERDAVRDYVAGYDGPEDDDFPGCVPIPMTAKQFDEYDGGVEYWSRELGVAWVARDGGPDHEYPGGLLPALLTRIALERGSPILCCGALRMVVADGASRAVEAMHPDQSVYLKPDAGWRPHGKHTVVGWDPRPDVVLEVDHTTDIRRRKLGIYARWGFPEVWAETPDEPSPSRPRGVEPKLTIHVLEDGGYREEHASAAFPDWRAADIHRALNEPEMSRGTIEELVRIGRVLGDREGTGPMDDVQIAGYMRRAHEVGQQTGFARGRDRGREEGMAAGREEGFSSAASGVLRLRGIALADDFERRLAATTVAREALLEASMHCSNEADFWARLAGRD